MVARISERNDMGRRRHERLPKMIDMCFGPFEDLSSFSAEQHGTLLDIGGGGLCFLADEPVDETSQIMMVLEFPGWQEGESEWSCSGNAGDIGVLKVVGIVMRCAPSGQEPEKYEVAVCFCGRVKK